MSVAQYIAKRLSIEGITHVFLVQGAANNDLIYAIADAPGIEYVACASEQIAGFAAEGWAKAKNDGTPGCAIATSGPGGQNLLTAIANCYYDSVPCIFITGQVMSKFLRPSAKLRQVGFQETDIVGMATPVTKFAEQITDPMDTHQILNLAFHKIRSGRRGPVLLDIPIDIQRSEIQSDNRLTNVVTNISSYAQPLSLQEQKVHGQIQQLIEALKASKRPLVLVGGGAQGKSNTEAVNNLIATIKAPAFPTWNALDVITSDHEYYGGRVGTYGGPGRNFAIQQCDLLLSVGCRLSGRITGGNPSSFAPLAHRFTVDVDKDLCDPFLQQQPFHININADVRSFYGVFTRFLPIQLPDWSAWRVRVFDWRDRWDPSTGPWGEDTVPVHPYAFARALSDIAPDNAIIISDCGGNAVVMSHAFRTKRGQRFFSSHGNSPMGFALAAALGAVHACPDRPVICVIGDGGFAINAPVLATLRETGAPVKCFILNNHGYGITRAYQQTNIPGGRLEASDATCGVPKLDLISIARAYGVQTERTFELNAASITTITDSMNYQHPIVFDVDCGRHNEYEPRLVGWDTPIDDMTPKLSVEELERERKWTL